MTDLVLDKYDIVEFDREVTDILLHIDLSEIHWTDDNYSENETYKANNMFARHILMTAQTVIAEKYLSKYYETVIPCESKIIHGITDKVLEWHNDRTACMEEIIKKVVPDHNLLCLFYFNTMSEGSVNIWNRETDRDQEHIVTLTPQQGRIVFLNETDPNIVHKVDTYDKSIARYIARFSYHVEGAK